MNYGKKGVKNKMHSLNSTSVKWGRKILLFIISVLAIAIIGVGVCALAGGLGLFKGILVNAPNVPVSSIVASGEATIVYDNQGNEIDQYVGSNSNRIEVSWEEVPVYLGYAFVAIEDERFFEHNGIDFKSIVRAGYQFIHTKGREAQGASTITQQLLKNTVFTDWTSEGDNRIKKIKRKIQEQYLALEVTKKASKEEILINYMNAINLGQNTLGVEQAAQRYFGKSCSELTISECAVIASITQNPSKYTPISHPEENVKRRKNCLDKMKELEFITQAQYDEAIADTEDVYDRIGLHDISYKTSSATNGSYFSDAVYEQVYNDLIEVAGYSESAAQKALISGGLRIESTQDPAIQAIADEAFANEENFPENVKWYLTYALTIYDDNGEAHNFSKENMTTWFNQNVNKKFNLIFNSQEDGDEAIAVYRSAMFNDLGITESEDKYEETFTYTPQPQSAMVIEDQSTGYVVAIVGGRGTKLGRRTLNRATSATRSPGSTFKVLASFAPAVDTGLATLATVYNDAPFNYDGGRAVSNWYRTGYRGINSIRTAIKDSMNIIAVKNQTVITPELGYEYLLKFGFTTLIENELINGQVFSDINQTIALGGLTKGVTPYELNAAYAAIANHGIYVEPKLYTRVLDSDGLVILDNTEPESHQVLKATTAYLMTSAMTDVVTSGTGTRASFPGMAIAGKTGTSTKEKDVWFAGFTPYYTCSVWTGYDNNVEMNDTEANISKNLFRIVMSQIHEGLPNPGFDVPEGLVQVTICSKSGKLPVEGYCDGCLKTEIFEAGTEPTEFCDIHYVGDICALDGLIATPECPFKSYGYVELPLVENAATVPGSYVYNTDGAGNILLNEDGTVSMAYQPLVTNYCHHTADFLADPANQATIDAEYARYNAMLSGQPAEGDQGQ
ncbi:MAG: transglycosylase domain-containing protein [Lachnospiraceae bacterium]|nr:transglycosylase domain-containing protein [Lachnospiraceae bacterium]